MRAPRILPDDRGQAMSIEVLRMFGGLIAAAVVLVLLEQAWSELDAQATNASTNATANTAWSWSQTIWTNLPTGILVISGLAILVVAVFLQQRVR